ncbi:MAG: hypothetical protein J6R47_04660 [Acholeplasmatales bacterium]|nr:hypothetical protein [Acholeplasmatales bacterium]
MARVNFDTAITNEVTTANTSAADSSQVGFLMLRNDGDEAIVRFMYDNVEQFDIHTVHTNVKVGERFREVNCLRDPSDPLDVCPFCQAQIPLQQKFVIKMTQYVIDNTNGQITPKPVVWERSLAYARTLKGYLDNYGPLTDILCKIIRHGKAGDQRTTYEIIPNLNKNIYPDNLYPKNTDIFGDYDPLGRLIYDKNFSEMTTYLQTGNFPLNRANNSANASKESATSIPSVAPRTYEPTANTAPMNNQYNNATTAPTYTAPAAAPSTMAAPVSNPAPQFSQPARQQLPWETAVPANNGGFERPVRRY